MHSLHFVGERPAFLLSIETSLLGAATTDVLLDGIERGDMLERLRNRRGTGGGKLVEVARHVRLCDQQNAS